MHNILAQSLTLPGSTTVIEGPLKAGSNTLGDILGNVFKFALPVAGIGLLIMIISAGFTLLTSAGDAKKMEKGKQTLTYAVAGFIVIFAAYWITQLAGIIFGIEAIGEIFK